MDQIQTARPCDPANDEREYLLSAYRAQVSAAMTLQRLLGLPPESCAVLSRQERLALAHLRQRERPGETDL